MALTLADVTPPNRYNEWAGVMGDTKYVVKDVTFDASYAGTADGETITAADLGYSGILSGQVLEHARTSDNESLLHTEVVPASDWLSASVRLYRYDGASAGKASFEEVSDAVDVSGYTARIRFEVF